MKGRGEVLSGAFDGSEFVIRGRLPGIVPCSFVESSVGGFGFALILQCQTEIVERFSIVRIWVAVRETLRCSAEVMFRFGKFTLAKCEQAERIVAADILRIARQTFLPVRRR